MLNPPKQKTLEIPALALAGLACLWLALLLCFPISHNDTWWHLKCGEWVLKHRGFPAMDVFSYSSALTTWQKMSWLFDVLAHGVYQAGGAPALVAAKIAVGLFSGLIILATARGARVPLELSVAMLMPGFLACRFYWTERPMATAQLLFVACMAWLALAQGAKRRIGILALGILWGNLNPSVVILPGFVGAFALGEWLEGKGFDFGAIVACALGGILNPDTVSSFATVARWFGDQSVFLANVSEWHPPSLAASPALAALFFALPLWIYLGFRQKKFSGALVILAASLPAARFGRLTPYFCMASALFGPELLKSALSLDERPGLKRALNLMALAGLLSSGAWMLAVERLFVKSVDETQFPIQAAEFLAAERPHGHLGHIFKDGSYLLFRLGPETQVLIDSRGVNYPVEVFKDAMALEASSPDSPRIMKKYGIECMLVPLRGRLSAPLLADGHWRLVYFDDNFLVFATAAELAVHQGRWPWYEGVDPVQASLNHPSPRTRKTLEARLKSQVPDAKGCYLLGQAYLFEKNWEGARLAFQAALSLDPSQEIIKETLRRLPR